MELRGDFMTKEKWTLIILGIMDLILVIMHYTDYIFLILKPTGYVIPLTINLLIIAVISFRSKISKIWTIIGVLICIPVILAHGFMIWLFDYSYTKIDSPHHQQSLIIEYRHATLGETTYFYDFYKTKFHLIGKRLGDEAITMMVQSKNHPGATDAEGALGLDNEEWLTANVVRFFTWQGMRDVHLNGATDSLKEKENIPDEIEEFINKANNNEHGASITINGNMLTLYYDEEFNQEWIEITNEKEEGAIPRQQCTRIIPDQEIGYYVLEECTHQWQYHLYPMREE